MTSVLSVAAMWTLIVLWSYVMVASCQNTTPYLLLMLLWRRFRFDSVFPWSPRSGPSWRWIATSWTSQTVFSYSSGTKKFAQPSFSNVHRKHCSFRDRAAAAVLAVRYVDDCVVESGGAGVWQAVLPLPFFMHGMVWTQGASLSLLQAHQFHRPTLTANWKRRVFLCAHQTRPWKKHKKRGPVSLIPLTSLVQVYTTIPSFGFICTASLLKICSLWLRMNSTTDCCIRTAWNAMSPLPDNVSMSLDLRK